MQAASLASSPALRYDEQVTSWPSSTRVVCWDRAASMVKASKTWVGSRRGTVSTWSYTQRWS